jgi:hypothetical protein
MLAGRASSRRGTVVVALVFGIGVALAVVLLVMTPVGAQQVSNCENRQGPQVPGVERLDADWCPDLTTRTLARTTPDKTTGRAFTPREPSILPVRS